MAKFVTEDGTDGISGDKFMMLLKKKPIKYHKNVKKLKLPHGKCNRHKLINTNMYDLLLHIQHTLKFRNECIIEMITNEDRGCNHRCEECIQRWLNDDKW